MKFLLPILAVSTGSLLVVEAANSPREHEWLAGLDEAEALARETGKPLLAVFR